MPRTSSKKRRTVGSVPQKRKTGRYGAAAIAEHLERFKKLHFNSGGELTQEKYAADHGIAAGTFSRWVSEDKKTAGTGSAAPALPAGNGSPVKGLLPAAADDSKILQLQKQHEKETGKAEAKIAELEEKVARLTQANEELQSGLAAVQLRNEQLTVGIKAVVGQL